MTKKQTEQFNKMLSSLQLIAKGFQTPQQLLKSAKKDLGLDYEEALEMAYENIKEIAKNAVRGVKKIRVEESIKK